MSINHLKNASWGEMCQVIVSYRHYTLLTHHIHISCDQ